MRIALVHDYLAQDGGAEKVLKALHEIWPEAPIFVLFHDEKKLDQFKKDQVKQSFLKNFPFIYSRYQWYLPLMPIAIEKLDLKNFDLVISSTSLFAKGVITSPNTLHISYCHTPPRFLWSDTHKYLSDFRYNFLIKLFSPNFIHRLRLWDKMSADRVDDFIANSFTVAKRIQKFYRREAQIINPPVEIDKFKISTTLGDYYLAGGRLVPYKKIDLVIKVFNRLGLPLKIFGDGPELKHLKKIAKPNIEFLGRITEEKKTELMSKSLAFINPQLEDFGITAIESMAAGRPVIAYGVGGAGETVIDGETGILIKNQTWESLFDTILNFHPTNWDSGKIRIHAEKFSEEIFKEKMQRFVNDKYEEFKKGLIQNKLF